MVSFLPREQHTAELRTTTKYSACIPKDRFDPMLLSMDASFPYLLQVRAVVVSHSSPSLFPSMATCRTRCQNNYKSQTRREHSLTLIGSMTRSVNNLVLV